jgi:sodium-dependent dicarboxylate transporter 2/3/5
MRMSTDLPAGPERLSGRTDVRAALLGGKTFRSLSEQALSPKEEKFERARQALGFFLAPTVAILFALLPVPMDRTQQLLAAVLLGVIILWICEPVPIPVGGLWGRRRGSSAWLRPAGPGPFGSTTIFTFIGAFILAQAMLKHGIAQRLAFAVLSVPGVAKSTYRVIVAFGVITCLLSAFVSNTATVAMLMPTALGILAVIGQLMQDRGIVRADFDPLRLRVGAALMLMLAYGASVGGLLTPVGSPPNLIGRGLIEEQQACASPSPSGPPPRLRSASPCSWCWP